MGKVTNTFIKSKLNKDLDARILPNGEYRDAQNVQVSRSEGANVGSLENVLGNIILEDFGVLTNNAGLSCIGYFADETNNSIYLFLTDYTDLDPASSRVYSPSAENYIYRYNVDGLSSPELLVQGNFLNFSKTNPIYGINLLEELLFWTDNRNQPRKINVTNPLGYYVNEDQISVAKYNPYKAIEMFVPINTSSAETTMKDVTSKYFPNGGSGNAPVDPTFPGGTTITLSGVKGDVLAANNPYGVTGAAISYINSSGAMVSTGLTVASIQVNTSDINHLDVTASAALPAFDANTELIFNPNPYYDENFAGDPNYLEDLFVRFSYRFRFEDGEYSIFAPFTQIAFIPKQDGYFMYVKSDGVPENDDQTAAYRSTIVSFVENKVDDISLRIPQPDTMTSNLGASHGLKITEIDILYKESDGLAVKVIETIKIANAVQSGTHWLYNYQSIKPFKTLPSDEIIRVYDKTPVRAFAQEIISNRVVYGNYQNKHTPPSSLNYNVAVSEKSEINLNLGEAVADGVQPNATTVNITGASGSTVAGSTISGWSTAPASVVTVLTINAGLSQITTDIDTGGITAGETINFSPASEDINTTSRAEYPNHSLKQNRSYQVGVVLSDRYGRQSTVILSNNQDVAEGVFGASTIYSPYIGEGVEQNEWAGESLKVLFNDPIGPSSEVQSSGWPGIFNGNTSSTDYNPLGWYTYKIVVKQTEQEYYNVYLGGIMAAYPEDTTLEIGNTSHTSLINDNINKVPRDLTEVGPDQKQYRSSVELFGRVNNTATAVTSTNVGRSNVQYYPAREADTVSTISTMHDLFGYDPTEPPRPDYFPQFYLSESNPLIARISTESQTGQIATTNYSIASALVDADTVTANVTLKNLVGVPTGGMIVTGGGLPEGITVNSYAAPPVVVLSEPVTLKVDDILTFTPATAGKLDTPGLQYLAVYETEPVRSNLDIFWETSTSGVISDLNTLILNSTGGGSGFSSFNTNGWTEAINYTPTSGANILSSDFSLVDSFGSAILLGAGDSFVMTGVRNTVGSGGQDVQVPGSEYFQLYETATPSFYNIRVLESYWDNIYYGTDTLPRNFEFSFQSVINGAITLYSEAANPNNEDVTLTPLNGESCGSTIVTNRQSTQLVNFNGINGANNVALRNKSLTWTISSQVNTANPSTQVAFFDITPIVIKESPEFVSNAWLTNISGGNMPAQTYTVMVELDDPASNAKCEFTFDMGTTPDWVRDYSWEAQCQDESQVDDFATCIINIQSSSLASQNGYYVAANYQTFNGLETASGSIISLNRTGPNSCTDWIYSPTLTGVGGALTLWQQCIIDNGCANPTTIVLDWDTIDASNNEFEII